MSTQGAGLLRASSSKRLSNFLFGIATGGADGAASPGKGRLLPSGSARALERCVAAKDLPVRIEPLSAGQANHPLITDED